MPLFFIVSASRMMILYSRSCQEMWLTKTMTFGGKKTVHFQYIGGVHFY